MIRNGDLDEDDLFDDKGKVDSDALTEALGELIDAKPHLVAGASNGGGSGSGAGRKVKGSADGGKGSGGSKDIKEMSAPTSTSRGFVNTSDKQWLALSCKLSYHIGQAAWLRRLRCTAITCQ